MGRRLSELCQTHRENNSSRRKDLEKTELKRKEELDKNLTSFFEEWFGTLPERILSTVEQLTSSEPTKIEIRDFDDQISIMVDYDGNVIIENLPRYLVQIFDIDDEKNRYFRYWSMFDEWSRSQGMTASLRKQPITSDILSINLEITEFVKQ